MTMVFSHKCGFIMVVLIRVNHNNFSNSFGSVSSKPNELLSFKTSQDSLLKVSVFSCQSWS